jgi:2-dehydro-3-deoxyphosphogluconate aldolase/(4S)-4-hydroxy-2-oxoglutarate aldolase
MKATNSEGVGKCFARTAADFIKAGASALGVGADLVELKAIREGQQKLITERAREFVRIVRKARS